MKKTYIALAVLAMAALAGCQETEFSNDTYIPEEGEVLIRVSNSDKTTKSADLRSERKGATISLGAADNGTEYVLEETITRLDDVIYAPATKGTPAYTENFSDLYGSFNAAVYKGSDIYEADGVFEEVDKTKLIYKRKYPNDIWDGKGTPNLYFFLRTPADYIDANTKGENEESTIEYNPANGQITFDYTSPTSDDGNDAAVMKDMLFTSRPLKTADEFNNYFTKADKGLPVLFHHALTGVKFAIAADIKDEVTITKVEFTGLATGGTCVITPRQEEETGYKDNTTGDYSSDDVSIWDPNDLDYTEGATFSQEFSGVVSYESAGTGVAHFGDSFYLAGNKNNLNDANASETFWFIPQPMTDNVRLKIYYKVGTGSEQDWTVDFGKTIKDRTTAWNAGELHTYTLRVDDVNLKIEDTVTNTVKSDVAITNTGNTTAFIRAAIVGQWLDHKNRPVFGFTDLLYNYYAVDSWYQDQFVNTEAGTHGTFTGLAGYKGANNPLNKWYLCDDGFYYYSEPVDPGKIIGTAPSGATNASDYLGNPLFTKYEIGTAPSVTISGVNTNIHFSLEIATQAVTAKKLDGSTYTTWQEAWKNATGSAPVVKQ